MISLRKALVIATLTFFPAIASAQYITVDESQTVEQLVQDVLINNSCANVSNISVNGLAISSGTSIGYFSAGTSSFPFSDGIILSTGLASSAPGPNSGILSEGPTNWAGDSDLEQALGVNNSINATVLEFDFMPLANKISFDYIFSSEQYLSSPSSNQCSYTDGFAFLLKEVGTNDSYQNLAVVPNTNIPVKVSTVRGPGTICPPANQQYFGGFNGFEHPTNYNGQTIILTAQADVIPNMLYHIKLVVADQGNNLYDSAIFLGGGSFKVEKDLGPDRLIADGNPLCNGQTLTLDATEPNASAYQWFKNGIAISGATLAQYQVIDAGIYAVEISLGATTCVSTGEIIIEYAAPPVINTPVTLIQCDPDNDGVAIFNLSQLDSDIASGSSVAYYETAVDAQNGTNQIANPTTFSNLNTSQLTASVTSQFGCKAFATVNLQLSNNTIAAQAPINVCDQDGNSDGFTKFNLNTLVTPQILNGLPAGLNVSYYASINNAEIQTGALSDPFTNTQPNQQIIFGRIENGPDCYGIVPITLVVNAFSGAAFDDEIVPMCIGTVITLQAPAGYASYEWSNGETSNSINVNQTGTFTVTITNDEGCEAIKTFIVTASGPATFVSADINDFAGANNSVIINYTGIGDYEFSLDGIQYQDSPQFVGLLPGEYSVFIKDTKGCGITGPIAIYVLDYPPFFSPNSDGYNDYWSIFLPESRGPGRITVMDRYGKALFVFNGNNTGWDGTFHSRPLPATDYWFVLQLPNGRTIKGHFSLIR